MTVSDNQKSLKNNSSCVVLTGKFHNNTFKRFRKIAQPFNPSLLDITEANFSVIILNSGFRIPDSRFFRFPVSGFRFPGFRVAHSRHALNQSAF